MFERTHSHDKKSPKKYSGAFQQQILEETKEALDSTTVERDDVILEHSKCSKKQICGVGISVCTTPPFPLPPSSHLLSALL